MKKNLLKSLMMAGCTVALMLGTAPVNKAEAHHWWQFWPHDGGIGGHAENGTHTHVSYGWFGSSTGAEITCYDPTCG